MTVYEPKSDKEELFEMEIEISKSMAELNFRLYKFYLDEHKYFTAIKQHRAYRRSLKRMKKLVKDYCKA